MRGQMLIDLVKRFSLTPLETVLHLHGSLVSVASNNQLVLDRLRAESTGFGKDNRQGATQQWRIVVEEERKASQAELIHHGFTHDGLTFIQITNGSFLAGDRESRCGISFIARSLIEEERLFAQYFLPALISMLAQMRREA